MLVKDLMTSQVEVVDRNDDLLMIDELMENRQIRHLPVVEDHKIVGLVTQSDMFKAMMSSAMGYGEMAQQKFLRSLRVKEVMVYPVVTVSPDTQLEEAIGMMMEKGIGCLPVVNGTQLVGMVTKTDLLRFLRTHAD